MTKNFNDPEKGDGKLRTAVEKREQEIFAKQSSNLYQNDISLDQELSEASLDQSVARVYVGLIF